METSILSPRNGSSSVINGSTNRSSRIRRRYKIGGRNTLPLYEGGIPLCSGQYNTYLRGKLVITKERRERKNAKRVYNVFGSRFKGGNHSTIGG